jgi:hypothetical protein
MDYNDAEGGVSSYTLLYLETYGVELDTFRYTQIPSGTKAIGYKHNQNFREVENNVVI